MGQHKTNPTAIAAKNGELPPKPKKKSKREVERELQNRIETAVMLSTFGGVDTKKAVEICFDDYELND